jgi:hypothetical protein
MTESEDLLEDAEEKEEKEEVIGLASCFMYSSKLYVFHVS